MLIGKLCWKYFQSDCICWLHQRAFPIYRENTSWRSAGVEAGIEA
jgi:hypothetical protein